MDDNKQIIEYKKENIFSKFFNWCKGLFIRKKGVESEVEIEHFEDDTNYDQKIIPKKNEKKISEKERFFKLYNDYKNNRISEKDISFFDLVRINDMINEEKEIYKRKK